MRAAGGKVLDRLPIVNGFGARLPAGAAKALAATDGVRAVTRNAAVEQQAVNAGALGTAYPSSINAPEAWNTRGIEVTGRGVGVAVIDTGIAAELADFDAPGATVGSRVVASVVTNPDATSAGDGYGHGTHVAGIVAGNSNERPDGDPLKGRYIGIAPEADLISVKVSDEEGNASVLDVIRGLQFVVDHKADYNIRVVNLSLESSEPGSYKTDPLDAAVEAAWFKGIVVVAAAGNRGSGADAVSYAPGNDPYAITVGAIDDQASKADGDDARPSWSSRGTTRDGIVKPDIHAPGAGIVSNLAPGSAFASMCPSCVVDGQMIKAGGTSMSAPVVSGAIALLLQKAPWLTPDQVKALLVNGARQINGGTPSLDLVGIARLLLRRADRQGQRGQVPERGRRRRDGRHRLHALELEPLELEHAGGGTSRRLGALELELRRLLPGFESADSIKPSRSSWSRSSWSTSWSK